MPAPLAQQPFGVPFSTTSTAAATEVIASIQGVFCTEAFVSTAALQLQLVW